LCFRRTVALILIFTFTSLEILPLGWSQTVAPTVEVQNRAPEKAPSQIVSEPVSQGPSQDSIEFLQNDSPLKAAADDKIELVKNPSEGVEPEDVNQAYEYERYDFEDAADLLRPEYATAVIVKELREEDLKALLDLPLETGILVLHGEIVLFTSGSQDEIGVLPAVKELVQKASFMSHTHPHAFSEEGPTSTDLAEAVLASSEEYVISRKGVYAYNHDGVLYDGEPHSFDWYLEKLNDALKASKSEMNQVEARADLNQFISEQDRYNSATEDEKEILRRGGTWTYNPGVLTAYLKKLSGTTYSSVIAGSSAGTTYSFNSTTSQYNLGYSVPNASDLSGIRISFDNPGTTTTVETKNLSTYNYIILGLIGPNATVRMDVVDINGIRDSFTLTDISSTVERFWQINVSAIASVDKSKIKSFEFYVYQSNTTSTTRTGTLSIHLDEYDMTPPAKPVITSTIPVATASSSLVVSGTKTSDSVILITGSYSSLTYPTSTTWSANLTLPSEGNNLFTITARNPLGVQSLPVSLTILKDTAPPTGSINIESGSTITSSQTVTLNLSAADTGSGVNKMSFSTDNVIWSAQENYSASKSFILPPGDGLKTVYVKYFDKAGNASSVYSKSITLRTAAFQEASGLVVIDAEHSHENISRSSRTWQFQKTTTGYSGEGYYFVGPDSGTTIDTGYATTSPELKYQINFQTTGTYYVWVRTWAPSDASNSVHIGLDGTSPSTSDRIQTLTYNSYVWTKDTSDLVRASINVTTTGNHTLNLWMREDGVRVDKIILTKDSAYIPSGIGAIESARVILVSQPTVNTVPTFTNQTTLSFSGTKPANTSIWVNGVQKIALSSSTSWSYTETLVGDGLKSFSIVAKDSLGNQSNVVSRSTTLDTTIPTGAININSGALYALSTTVTLNLSAADTGSGIDKMSFSTNNSTWTTAEAYAASKSFTLPIGDGVKTIYVKFYDKAGNLSAVYSKSITLDTLPPTGTIQVNNGATAVKSTAVTLNLSATDASGISQMSFSSDNITYTTPQTYGANKSWTFSTGDGNKTVYVKFLDKSGRWSTPISVTVLLDTVLPTGTININSGAAYTNSTTVTLNLSGIDAASGIDKMSFSTNNSTWTALEVYATSKSFTLPTGDGSKTVYVKFYDRAGNQSSVYSKSISLDTVIPTGSIKINNDAGSTSSVNVTLNLSGSDTGSGLNQMRFSPDAGITWTNWEVFATTKSFTLPSGDGVKEIRFQLQDRALNTATFSDTITLSAATAPTVVFTSSQTATNPNYTLTYTVDGVPYSETWKLAAGVNQLMVQTSVPGRAPAYAKLNVTLSQTDPVVPSMPSVPVLASNLVSVTTQDGLILKYDQGALVAVEKPDEYQLYSPSIDTNGNLTGGLLVFNSGDKLLYQNSAPIYEISIAGEKTYYYPDGTVRAFETSTGQKTRFAYRLDSLGTTVSILSLEDIGTSLGSSLYEANGKVDWILTADGTDIRYESGILKQYKDSSGNRFDFVITQTASGYRSELTWVTPSGQTNPISYTQIQTQLASYPTIKQTLEQKLAKLILYDAQGKILEFDSGLGEVLTLQNQLPISLRDKLGVLTVIGTQVSASGALESISLDEASNPDQTFDSEGNLKSVRLSDGSVLQVSSLKVNEIVTSDGSVLSSLVWNGSSLTGFIRTKLDGTKEVYQNSALIRREESSGVITNFIRLGGIDQPDTVTTADGRTYKFIEYRNELGLNERLSDLKSMDLPDGSRIEFEAGKPIRYIQHKEVILDPYEVPALPAGESYVPSLQLADAELRSVTIDSSATILSGEILFRDGTQYFIKDGVLLKQVTPDGRVLETLNQSLPPFVKPAPILPDALNTAEVTYRNQAVDSQLAFFVNGVGIEPNSGMPLDNYKGTTPSNYSQATLVGFWAEILSTIARNDYTTTTMTQLQAFQKLSALLTEFQKVQQQAGWNGMVAFFKIERVQEPILDSFGNPTGSYQWVNKYTRQFDTVGLGDNLNLSLSLATVIGALSNISLSSTLNTYRNQIISSANQILTAQDQGYSNFFDPTTNRFRMGYQFIGSSGQYVGYMDRVFNEFRPGLIWLASRNPSYKVAVDNLDVTVRSYTTTDGKQIDNAVPFDGNAFQMFWPLIHVDETKYQEFDVALKNFLYAQSEYVSQNNIPGLISAGDSIGSGYNGKMGVPALAETDDPLQTNVGSIYGTASAFPLAPHYALQFLKNLETLFPGIKTTKGYIDALKLGTPTIVNGNTVQNPIYSQDFYGVDQASFILSLLNKSQSYFSNYLTNSGLASGFDSLYQAMSFGLNPAAVNNQAPPSFGSTVPALYTGSNQTPDGRSNDLTKQPAFISTLIDNDFGEGHLFNYLNPDGKFHHSEIEFGEGVNLRRMNLGEYLLLPGRSDTAKSLLEGFTLDFLNSATSQGAFYTENNGYANAVLTTDPEIGEVRHVEFDLKNVTAPVGLWAQYSPTLDLSKYDFLSIPVRLGPDAPDGVGIKIELKGLGEIFVTGPLDRGWQYFQIPVAKPTGLLREIAISIHNPNGPAAGDLYLGPLSAFKVRTTSQIDWVTTLGKTDTEMRNLLISKVMTQNGGGGLVQRDQVLRNFTIDSDGKLIDGILDLADGSTQYFKRSKLTKWVFRNGRTVLFENGLASFIMDLAHGTLEEGRFYYDQSFNGDIRSFIVQDNFGKRVFGSDGLLQTMVLAGQIINFKNGLIDSIITPTGTLTNLIFADDQSLIKAHVRLNDGREFDIDQTGEQVVDKGNGTKVHYLGSRITSIETTQNGRTDFTYRTDAAGEITGVDAIFNETVIDPITLVSSIVTRTMSLFEYIQRPERSLEKAEIVTTASLIPISSIGGFSVGTLPSGEITHGVPQGGYLTGSTTPCASPACYRFKYNTTTGATLGVSFTHTQAATISDFDFLLITLSQDPSMTWNQDFNVKLKTSSLNTLYTFLMSNVPAQSKTYEFSLAGKSGTEGQITLEAVRESAGVSKTGTIYIQDIAYASVKTLDHPIWEDETGLSRSQSQKIRIESGILTQVGREIAQGTPLLYSELIPFLDLPTRLIYSDLNSTDLNQLVNFRRFDGAEVTLSGQNVTKVILPDGTINEYSGTVNAAQSVLRDQPSSVEENGLEYHYGALRKTTQPDGHELTFTYEFDTDGKEITVVKDSVTGDIRRFKEGKLISSNTTDLLETHFGYEAGNLASSELLYKNRVLDSTRYHFINDETHVTDERGTTWYYDANGNLIKHLTKDGYLFEYLDYTQSLGSQVLINPTDYKNTIFTATDLKAIRLKGYESSDGSQLIFNDEELGEVKLINGDQAVNLDFDSLGRIRTGQIQLSTGIVISIEDYLPVSGRKADGSVFNILFPASSSREILFKEDGSFDSFKVELDGKIYYYDIEGKLIKASFPESKTYDFTYLRNLSGVITGYQVLESAPILFRGIPYPKAVTLKSEGSGATRKLSFVDGTSELALRNGSGFVASIFNESIGAWDTLTGTFSSSADRFALKNFLNGVRQGDYLAVLISDSALGTAGTTTERNEIFTLLESMGSGKIREAATTSKDWSFFGMKGLSLGEGAEELKTLGSVGTSSSVKQVQTTYSVSPGVVFNSVPVFLNTPVFEMNAFISFLSRYKNYQPDYEVQALSVYNSKDELVYSERLDGIRTYYENGLARETFDESGELLYVYQYDSEGRQNQIQIIKAEADFNQNMAEIRAKIEEEKFNALYQLAWRDEAARLQIKEQVESGLQAIDDGISQLEGQRYQEVEVCKRKWLFFKSCHMERVEVQGVVNAINDLHNQKSSLLQTQERELAKIGTEIEAKRLEVESQASSQMTQLAEEERKFKENVIHQEMDPIIINFYRDILGRDPSTAEIDSWINTYRTAGVIDTVNLVNTLTLSSERTSALNQKQTIINSVETFLTNYLAQTTDAGRQTLLTQLGLNLSETVSLDQIEVTAILDWLKSRDLHFGQSAFLSLKEMLASRGKTVATDVIGKESILIDILTGTINKFTEGDLLISVFALSKTAKIHTESFSNVKYTFDDLKALYLSVCPVPTNPCSLRVIAHIGEDHFVIITKVTDTEVSYRETTKGVTGEEQTVAKAEFLKVWQGYLVVSDQYAVQTKKITDQEAQKIKGAFLPLIFLALGALILKAAAVVYAIVTFVVSTVMAVVATVLNVIVNTISFVFAKIAEGITLIAKGFFNLSKLLYQGIKFTGRFLMKGFQFLKEGFSNGLERLGSGISKLKSFLLKPTGKPFVDALGHNILDAQGNILRHFSFQQVVARNLVAATINYGASKGLEGLGLNLTLSRLAGAFVGAGFLGIGSAASSFFKSGVQGLLLQGVSEMGLKLNLPPPITGAISLITGAALTSYFDSSLTLRQTITQVAPKVVSKLTLGGIDLLGRSLGIDARVMSLIGLPLSATIGGLVGNLVNPNGGGGPGGIWNTLKNGLSQNPLNIGIGFGETSILRSITSGSLLSSVDSAIGQDGLFQSFFNLARSLVLSPINLIGNIVSNIKSFASVIQEKGFGEALESVASNIFGHQTLETIFNAGGLSSFLSQVKTSILLPTGTLAQELKLSGVASLFFDLAGNFIGILENGVYRIGEFAIDAVGKIGLTAGKIYSTLFGHTFEGNVQDGTLSTFKGVVDGVVIEGEGGDINIPGPIDNEPKGSILGDFFTGILKVAAGLAPALVFAFENGLLERILTGPNAEASEILPLPLGLPGTPINLANLLLQSLLREGSLTSTQVQQVKDNFTWLAHYTDADGFEDIGRTQVIEAGNDGAFFSKEIPTTDSPELLGGARREIAMSLQLAYRNSDHINPEKAAYFFVVDSEDFGTPIRTGPVARTSLKDPDGNVQSGAPFTGATEYVFDHNLIIAGKIIWSGFNSVVNWGAAMLAILKYFIDKV